VLDCFRDILNEKIKEIKEYYIYKQFLKNEKE